MPSKPCHSSVWILHPPKTAPRKINQITLTHERCRDHFKPKKTKKKHVETTDSPNTETKEGGYQRETIVFNVAPSCSPSAPAGSPHRIDSGDSDWWLDVMKNGIRYDQMLIGFRMCFVSFNEVCLILILIQNRTILWMSRSVMWVRSISFRMVVDVNGKFRVSSPVKPCTHPTFFSKWRRRLAMRRMS